MQSMTLPSTTNVSHGSARAMRAIQMGLAASSTSGWRTMLTIPSAAIVRNHSTMMGLKKAEILEVPSLWSANSPTSVVTVSGSTQGSKAGDFSWSPSKADSTEIAGVMIPSAYSSAVPSRPMKRSGFQSPKTPPSAREGVSASSAMMPPSPLLSARRMSAAYFTPITMTSDQKMIESTPIT